MAYYDRKEDGYYNLFVIFGLFLTRTAFIFQSIVYT